MRGVDRRQRQNGQAFHLADVSPTGILAIQVNIPTAVRQRFQSRLKKQRTGFRGAAQFVLLQHTSGYSSQGLPFFCAIGFPPGQVHRTVPSGEPQYRRLSGGLHRPRPGDNHLTSGDKHSVIGVSFRQSVCYLREAGLPTPGIRA